MPEGRRRRDLGVAFAGILAEFAAILPFTSEAAAHHAEIIRPRRTAGRPFEGFDGLIVATVRSVGATIATRNISDFEGCGVDLVDPLTA